MEQAHAIAPAVILLATGLVAILLARPLRLSPIVGFLIAGVVIGPHGLRAIEEGPTTHLLAELGVVFLLFDIGLHFSLEQVVASRRDLLGLGPLQVALCGLAAAACGWALGLDPTLAVVLGTALALSSTAVVSRVLVERNLTTCPLGRSATAVLIFQDVAAIFLLAFATLLGQSGGEEVSAASAVIGALWKTALAVGLAVTLGRLVVGPAFRGLARTRNEEVFTAAALFVVLATAWATGAAGLSLTLGAFLAGMIIAETPYRHVVQIEARPFRNLLMGFFFMSVGMALEPAALLASLPAVLAISAGLLVAKTGFVFLSARLVGWTLPGATQLGFLLAQGSEFALVLIALPGVGAALGAAAASVLVAALAISLAATPAWVALGLSLARRLAARGRTPGERPAAPEASRPILLFGMNDVGRLTADALRLHGVPHVAIESDPDRFLSATADGYAVTWGDPSDLRLMDAIGGTRARAVALATPRFDISRELTPVVRERYPGLGRFVAVADESDLERHTALGMTPVMTRGMPHGIELAAALLRFAGVAEEQIADWLETICEAHAQAPPQAA
jgi:CPA2 family monovalent cation:H+ antiporter-2